MTRPSRRVNSWPKPDKCRPKPGGGSLSHCRDVSSSESRPVSEAGSSFGSSEPGKISASSSLTWLLELKNKSPDCTGSRATCHQKGVLLKRSRCTDASSKTLSCGGYDTANLSCCSPGISRSRTCDATARPLCASSPEQHTHHRRVSRQKKMHIDVWSQDSLSHASAT